MKTISKHNASSLLDTLIREVILLVLLAMSPAAFGYSSEGIVFNIPAPANVDQPFVRLYNTTTSAGAVTGTLYDQNGNVLGNANSTIISSLGANSVQVITAADIATATGAPTWSGRAWMVLQANFSGLRVANLIRSSLLLSMSCLNSQFSYYLPSPGGNEQPYLRLYNTSGTAGAVNGTLYDESGNVIGTPNAVLVASLAANSVQVLAASDIAAAVGVNGWTGTAWLHLTSGFSGLNIMSTLRDMTTNTLTDMSCGTGSSGTATNVYNIPPVGSTTTASVRIYNTSSSSSKITGTLYGESGAVLGKPDVTLATLAPHAVLALSQTDIANSTGANPWTGRAWMQINSSVTGLKVLATTKQNMLMEMSCADDNFAFNIPDATNGQDQPIIRLYNTSATTGNVYGTLYDVNGNVLGSANSLLVSNMSAKSVATLKATSLASAVGVFSWSARAWLSLRSDFSGLKILNVLQDLVSGNWSNMSCSTGVQEEANTYSAAATVGELVDFTLDPNSLTYSYSITDSLYNLEPRRIIGTLVKNLNGTFSLSGMPGATAAVLPNGVLLAAIRENFNGTIATEPIIGVKHPLTTISAIAGTYNYNHRSCTGPFTGCSSATGTIQINTDASWVSCNDGNLAAPPATCSKQKSGTLSYLGNGQWEIMSSGTLLGTLMAINSGGQNAFMADMKDRGIMVAASQQTVAASQISGTWLVAKTNGDWGTVSTDGATVNWLTLNGAAYSRTETLSLNSPWTGLTTASGGSQGYLAGIGVYVQENPTSSVATIGVKIQ